jgi:hypothetical protein
MGKIRGGWRNLHNEPHNSHSSTDIIKMIEPGRMRYAGYVARIGQKAVVTKFEQ